MADEFPLNGFNKHLGLAITYASADLVRAELTISAQQHQDHGIVHGGVYCAVVEYTASLGASHWLEGRGRAVGMCNTTHFLRPVATGVLSVQASPLERGAARQLWQVFIRDNRDRLISKGELLVANILEAGPATDAEVAFRSKRD